LDAKKENTLSDDREEASSSNTELARRERGPKRNNKGNGNKRLFEKSKEKPKKDLRVLLGLNGDTDDGWR
jgi:ribosomal protein L44E